jgi:hypothetical protein
MHDRLEDRGRGRAISSRRDVLAAGAEPVAASLPEGVATDVHASHPDMPEFGDGVVTGRPESPGSKATPRCRVLASPRISAYRVFGRS